MKDVPFSKFSVTAGAQGSIADVIMIDALFSVTGFFNEISAVLLCMAILLILLHISKFISDFVIFPSSEVAMAVILPSKLSQYCIFRSLYFLTISYFLNL